VSPDRALADPPALHLEVESSQIYLRILLYIMSHGDMALVEATGVEERLVQLCARNLERFEQNMPGQGGLEGERALPIFLPLLMN
jgi:hypothetical protein